MAFSEPELRTISESIKKFSRHVCEIRQLNRKIDVTCHISGQGIIIGEQLLVWKAKMHTIPVAKITYTRTRNIWTLFKFINHRKLQMHTVASTLQEALMIIEIQPEKFFSCRCSIKASSEQPKKIIKNGVFT